MRLSVAITASADGGKSKIYIIVPRATELPNYVPPDNVVLKYKTSGTFNDEVICNYMDEIMSDKAENTILILGSARCHLTSKVSQKFAQKNLKRNDVPPRMTNLLQPADVSWFNLIKAKLQV